MTTRQNLALMIGIRNPRLLELLAGAWRIRDAYHRRRLSTRRIGTYRSQFYAEVWHEAATQLGATVEELGCDILQIRLGESCTRVQCNCTAIDDPVTISMSRSKPLVYKLLARRGLKVPAHCEFTLNTIDAAFAFLKEIGECVVKPAQGSGGCGVTTGITRTSQLIRGAVAAAAYCSSCVIEQQVKGDVYRLLYLDGKLLDAVLRRRPRVIGDGQSTVGELVCRENQQRLAAGPRLAHIALSPDADMLHTLSKQGLGMSSVPRKDSSVTLKTVINENSQMDNISAMDLLCRSIIEDGAAAAAAVGIRFAGVDVITPDPSVSLSESGGAITDVNTTPALHPHYYKKDGRCPVAIDVLPCLLAPQHTGSPACALVA